MPANDPTNSGVEPDKHLSHNKGNPVHDIYSPPPRPLPGAETAGHRREPTPLEKGGAK
jgi:hypothetical protein